MADTDVQFSIGATVDPSIQKAREALAGIGEAAQKTAQAAERAKSLDSLGKSFAQMAAKGGDAAQAATQLKDKLTELNASEAEIAKVVTAFNKEAEAIKRVEQAAEKAAAAQAARLQKEIDLAEAAAYKEEKARTEAIKRTEAVAEKAAAAQRARLEKEIELAEIAARKENERRSAEAAAAQERATLDRQRAEGANERLDTVRSGVGIAGDTASAVSTISGVTGADLSGVQGILELAEAIPLLVTGVQGLPDSIRAGAEALGLLKTAQEASKTASAATTAIETTRTAANTALAASEGGAAAGAVALNVALGPLAVAAVAVGAAVAALVAIFKIAQRDTEEAGKALERRFAAQDEIDSLIRSGASLEEAYKQQADYQLEAEQATRRHNEAIEASAQDFARRASSGGIFGDLSARLQDVFNVNSNDDKFNERIKTTAETAANATAKFTELGVAIDGGAFAAEDAASKGSDDTKKADDAAAAQAKQQAAAEKAQADAARKQEQAAAKQQAAAEKAQAEAEQAAQKIADAREAITKADTKYSEKLQDLAKANQDKIADIRKGAIDKAQDTERSYYRDTVKLAQDARLKELDAQKNAARAEADARVALNRKLEDIRDNALASEEEAVNSRNFLQAAKAKEALDAANKNAAKEAARASDDRAENAKREAEDRYSELQQARVERARQLAEQREDNKIALSRQLRDQKENNARALQEAQTAHQREIAELQRHLAEVSAVNQAFYAQQVATAQGASTAAAQAAASATGGGGGGPSSGGRMPLGGGAGSFTPGSGGGFRPISPASPLNNVNNSRTVVNINANSSADVYNAVQRLGLI